MDAELKFIISLLRSNRNDQEDYYCRQIPKGIFISQGDKISWISDFRERHGKYPSMDAFRRKFTGVSSRRFSDPLDACLQPILDMAMFTQMNKLNGQVKKKLDAGTPVEEAMAVFKQGAEQLTQYTTDYVDVDLALSGDALRRYRLRVKAKATGRRIDTPWPTLTKIVKYFTPGEVILLTARLGMGKTWTYVFWCHYYAMMGFKCLFVTKEMTTQQIEDRFTSLRYQLSHDDFRDGSLKPAELRRWRREAKLQSDYPVTITGQETMAGFGVEQVVGKIQQYKPEITFLDGAYLLKLEGVAKNAGDTEKLRALSNRLKVISKFTNVVLHASVQLNREAEKKDGTTKASIGNIYNCDAWAQDADGVAALEGKRGAPTREIAWLKGRESGLGSCKTKFELSPHPDFGELRGASSAMASASGAGPIITFKGVK